MKTFTKELEVLKRRMTAADAVIQRYELEMNISELAEASENNQDFIKACEAYDKAYKAYLVLRG